MNWDEIRENHKEENRTEKENQYVKRMCEISKEKIGWDIDPAMVHKWLKEKSYNRENPQPDFIYEAYKQWITEFGGNFLT